MPIYSCMGDMDEIEEEVARRTLELIITHQTIRVTGDAAVDFVLGHLSFAEAEPALYRIVYTSQDESQRDRKRRMGRAAGERLHEVFSKDPKYAHLPGRSLTPMLERLLALAHGYASLRSAGLLESIDQADVVRLASLIVDKSR